MGVDGIGKNDTYEYLEKRPSRCSCIPFVSIPLGLFHIGKGMGALIICIAKVASKSIGQCREKGLSSYKTLSLIKEKQGIYDALDMIAQGIFEMVPGIGNLAIVKSTWWHCADLRAEYEEKYQQIRLEQDAAISKIKSNERLLDKTYAEVFEERDALRKEVDELKGQTNGK